MRLVLHTLFVTSCGRVLRNMDEAEFHAAKSGHANFSESTEEKRALTEEEKKEQLAKYSNSTSVHEYLIFNTTSDKKWVMMRRSHRITWHEIIVES